MVFRTASRAVVLVGWWLVSGVSGKSQYSIVLLAIEKARPLVVDDVQRWVSLEGRLAGMALPITARTQPLIPFSKIEIIIPVL